MNTYHEQYHDRAVSIQDALVICAKSQNPCHNDAICPSEHLHTAIDSATNAQNDGAGSTPLYSYTERDFKEIFKGIFKEMSLPLNTKLHILTS